MARTDVDGAKPTETEEATDDHPSRADVSEESSSPSGDNTKHADEPGEQQANPKDDRDINDTTGEKTGD